MSTTLTGHDRPSTLSTVDADDVIPITRRRLDRFLIGLGAAVVAVLVAAGILLSWGSDFAEGYVEDELAAQQITFPSAEALAEEGRSDLAGFADEQLATGQHAEAYASYIGGHLAGIADGATYAELGGPERAAQAALADARDNGVSETQVEALEAEATAISGQRDSLFKGEMLRGTLLNAFAWSTMGRIAGIAATVAFVGAGVLLLLVIAGWNHLRGGVFADVPAR